MINDYHEFTAQKIGSELTQRRHYGNVKRNDRGKATNGTVAGLTYIPGRFLPPQVFDGKLSGHSFICSGSRSPCSVILMNEGKTIINI